MITLEYEETQERKKPEWRQTASLNGVFGCGLNSENQRDTGGLGH